MTTMTYDETVAAFPTWSRLTRRLGRNDLPEVLMINWHDLAHDELAYAIDEAWHMAEYPERMETTKDWKLLMHQVGYIVDGAPAERPEKPVRLWRGATPEGRAGMAWSSDRATAEWFRDRLISFGLDGRLWTAEPTPRRLLAASNGRSEHEVVVNTSGLAITEVSR